MCRKNWLFITFGFPSVQQKMRNYSHSMKRMSLSLKDLKKKFYVFIGIKQEAENPENMQKYRSIALSICPVQ